MRFTLPLALGALIPAATALQTIYLGYATYGRYGPYVAWFSDSDVCSDGTAFGSIVGSSFSDYCNKDITILGHTNITFTGCQGGNYAGGVSDLGAPALTCSRQGYESTNFDTRCNGPAVSGYVTKLEYCS